MAELEKSIIVNAPLHEVYKQWTQFEEFPRFMEGVLEVRQLDDRQLSGARFPTIASRGTRAPGRPTPAW